MPIFNGIKKTDKDLAIRIIQYDDSASPLFIDLTESNPSQMFHFVRTNAREQQREFIAERRLNKNLPTDLKKKLKKSIEEKIAIEQAVTRDT